MRRLLLALALALAIAVAAPSAFAQDAVRTESGLADPRVAEALAAAVRARMGEAAMVSIERMDVVLRGHSGSSLAVTIAPGARLDRPVEFTVIGSSSSGRAAMIGRGRADVHVEVPHATLVSTLTRGTVLTSEQIQESTGDPGAALLQRLPTSRELAGAALRRDTAAGEVLTRQAVTLPPAVRAGDLAQAHALMGPVQAVTEVTVMENGAEGAIVRVVNRESRRELRARVIRPGVVEVIHE
jgi:flagella basal body P-ring formation protein FlgA